MAWSQLDASFELWAFRQQPLSTERVVPGLAPSLSRQRGDPEFD